MTRYRRLLALFLTAGGLAACALVGPNSSYVASLPAPTDAQVLAGSIGGFLVTQLPAASTTIALTPIPQDQAGNPLTPVLANTLRQKGFAVAEGSAPPAGAHTLRYWVTPLDGSGALVRLTIDGRKDASRLFVRIAGGGLRSGGPFTVVQRETAP